VRVLFGCLVFPAVPDPLDGVEFVAEGFHAG
jgi:hypothetical protein